MNEVTITLKKEELHTLYGMVEKLTGQTEAYYSEALRSRMLPQATLELIGLQVEQYRKVRDLIEKELGK